MNHYEQKQQARRERLEARADRLRRDGEGRIRRAKDMASTIPFGQPILVGHHSEKGDRAYRGRIRGNFEKGFEALKAADEVAGRAASVGLGGISSDDPDSVEKLREKLAAREARQAAMTERNKQARRDKQEPPHAAYEFSNNSANIRRIKARIGELEKMATRETTETLHNSGVRLVENAEENRVQLIFPGKPDDATRAMLKQHGFRWSPMQGAWQRHLNGPGRYAASCVLDRLAPAAS